MSARNEKSKVYNKSDSTKANVGKFLNKKSLNKLYVFENYRGATQKGKREEEEESNEGAERSRSKSGERRGDWG